MAQFFDNRTIIAPSTEVAIDDSQIGPVSTASQQINVGIVGVATLGAPASPVLVTSVDQALAAFGQGTLVDGIRRALSPVAGGGAQQVYGVKVNAATKGTLDLLDSLSGHAIHLDTRDYGIATRSAGIKLEAATNAGSGNVPAGALKATASNSEFADNLGYNLLLVEPLLASGRVSVNKWSGTMVGSYTAGNVASIAVTAGGSGYISVPAVTVAPPTVGTTATAHAVLTSQAVTSIVVDDGGSGYTSATPPVVTISGPGVGAAATATVTAPQTSITVTTSVTGQSPHQLIGQQIVIHSGGGEQLDFTTTVTNEASGVLTVFPGDPFSRNANSITGVSAALLLYSAGVSDQAGLALSAYGNLSDLATAASGVGTNWLVVTPSSVTTPNRFNASPLAVTQPSVATSPLALDVGQSYAVTPATTYVLTGIAQSVTDWLNGSGQSLFTAVRGSVQSGRIPSLTFGFVRAAGGADDASGGSVQAGTVVVHDVDWTAALKALGTVDTPLFTLMSGDPAVILLGDKHASDMSSTGRMERIQICGLELGHSTDKTGDNPSAIAEAIALSSFRSYLLYPGIYDFDANGQLNDLPGYYGAAMAAGLAAGLGENVALTGKALRIKGLEHRSLANGGAFDSTDVNTCLQSGVMPLVFRPGRGFVIVQSISTWQQDTRYSKREMSVRRILDRLARSIRERLDERIGDGVTTGFLNSCLSDAQSVLEEFARRDFIVGDDQNPPYVGLQASVEQGRPDTVLLSVQVSPTIPANYILVTVHATAFGN